MTISYRCPTIKNVTSRTTHGDIQNSLGIRHHRYKICSLHSHTMFINAKFEMLISRNIDDSHPILLSRYELKEAKLSYSSRQIFVLPVDKTCICWNGRHRAFSKPNSKNRGVEVILQCDSAEINVPIRTARPVDYDRDRKSTRMNSSH